MSLLIAIFIGWQGIGYYLFNKDIKPIQAESNNLKDKMDKLGLLKNLTLVQVINQIKADQKTNDNLIDQYSDISSKFIILPFLKNSSVYAEIIKRQNLYEDVLAKCDSLISIIQRSKQTDNDINSIINSPTITWATAFDKVKSITDDNDKLKTELSSLVVPDGLNYYYNSFVNALSEKGQFLFTFNDFIHSAYQSQYNREQAIQSYNGAYYYWDYQRTASYVTEAEKYENQAQSQMQEAMVHWKKYLELRKDIDDDIANKAI